MDTFSQNYYSHYYPPNENGDNERSNNKELDFIPHPSEKKSKEDNTTTNIFIIDSRQRDISKFPTPNNYNIDIPSFYKNVKSIELKGAILPKTEYNIHSCNNIIPFIIGDFLYSIVPKTTFFSNNYSFNMIPDGETITFTVTGGTVDAILTADTLNGGIGPITIVYGGYGYSPDNLPKVVASVSTFPRHNVINNFTIKVGIYYEAELREGQYSNCGNPKYVHLGIPSAGVSTRTPIYSQTPVVGLSREIENAMADAIYSRISPNYAISNQRIGWYELNYNATGSTYAVGAANQSKNDYPAPISVRYVNQYPVLNRYSTTNITGVKDRTYYDTNSCNFNRIQFSNNLVIRLRTTDDSPTNKGGIFQYNSYQYTVIDFYEIGSPNGGTDYDYMLVLQPTGTCASTGASYVAGWEVYSTTGRWRGIESNGTLGSLGSNQFLDPSNIDVISITTCPWHLPFKDYNSDITMLLGFSKINYCSGTLTKAIYVDNLTGSNEAVLQAIGYTHRTDFDWTLSGSPEYVILSFRSPLTRSAGSADNEINNRVDSDNESNVGRSFACMIFDNNTSAVLQGLTYTNGANYDISGTYQANSSEFSGIAKAAALTVNTTSDQYIRHLDGYVGNTSSAFSAMAGATKSLKGADLDVKKIVFKQAVARLDNISIQFSKFNKVNTNSTKELYDFKGKEHFIMFEIVTADNYNSF